MSYRHLEIDEPAAGVVRCVMSNPPTHTLVAAELAEVDDFLTTARGRKDLRVLVFTGGGEGVFIRHYEVGELADASERQVATRQATRGEPTDAKRVAELRRSTVASAGRSRWACVWNSPSSPAAWPPRMRRPPCEPY